MKSYLCASLFFSLILVLSCNNAGENAEKNYFSSEDSIHTNSNTYQPGDEDNRVLWQKPNTVVEELGDLSSKSVADLGAGTGFFSFRILPRAEKVIALEIDTSMISFIEKTRDRLPEDLRDKLEIRLVQSDDPGLKSAEVDVILIVNTVAYLTNRSEYFQKLKDALKSEGKIVIIDFKKNQSEVGPEDQYKLEYSVIVDQLTKAGFDDIEVDNSTLDYQYIITARVKSL